MNLNNCKVAIFENINSAFYKNCVDHLNKKDVVCFFRISDKFLNKPLIKGSIESGRLIDASKLVSDYSVFTHASRFSHENIDCIFNGYSTSSLMELTNNLYGSPEVEDVYKKELLDTLKTLYEMELKINSIVKDNPNRIVFYPASYYHIHAGGSSLLSKNIEILKPNRLKLLCNDFYSKLQHIVLLFYPFYILFKKTRPIPPKKNVKKQFDLGINANLPDLFGYNYHYINYIVDDIFGYPKDKILFIDETFEAQYASGFEKYGYSHMDFKRKRESISLYLMSKLLISFIPAWILCFAHSFFEEYFVIKATRIILTDFIKWNLFSDCYSIKNSITVLLPDNVSKNLILEKEGVNTWHIYPDNYGWDYHTGWDENIPISSYAFMRVNNAVVYGGKMKRYFGYNRNKVKTYHEIGVLTSQWVREIKEGKLKSDLYPISKKKKLPEKIVAVFDTSFVDFGPLKIADGVRFGEDILKLLNEMPEIGIVFKEKKFLSITPELAPVYEKLEQHERCYVVRKSKTDFVFSYEVIASADLVISAAYTSTTAEALGARTKAIYYDVAGTDIGDNYYFNKFPNFVAHDYEELKRLVKYWLYDMNGEKFEEFLNTYVKGEIDPYMDGKAIDRLHILLK